MAQDINVIQIESVRVEVPNGPLVITVVGDDGAETELVRLSLSEGAAESLKYMLLNRSKLSRVAAHH